MALKTFGGEITLVSVSDGAAGSSFSVEFNHNKIYKFYSRSASEVSYSPDSFVFKVTAGASILPINEFTSEISLIGPGPQDQVDNIWALLSRLYGHSTEEGATEIENFLDVARTINTTNNTIEFNFAILFGYAVTTGATGDIALFNKMLGLIREKNCYFIIKIFQSNSLLVSGAIPVEFGTSEDMAKFAVTSNAIQGAVNDAKLRFDADGLSITNGGLTVYNNENKKVFYYDINSNELQIEGNGKFTGEVNASSGSFTGQVTAEYLTANIGGSIGGFTIDAQGLYSRETKTVDGVQVPTLQLISNGNGSYIDVDTINLGTGAHVKEFIQLGNAYLWNPEANGAERNFIEVYNEGQKVVTLNDRGILRLGDIEMNGQSSTISGNSFTITPNLATFSNVTVSGKISTAIFEKGHIQSIGGIMLFKTAYKIEGYNGNVITLDQAFEGEADQYTGNYVYVINEDGEPVPGLIRVRAKDDTNKTVTLWNESLNTPFNYNDKNIITLIDIGKENDLMIGVNSSNTRSNFLMPRGITISEFTLNTDKTGIVDEGNKPKLYLGDLDNSGISFSGVYAKNKYGFGLYSENVYLTGSLTTKIIDGDQNISYAGVNTLDGVGADKFDEDTSPIVFWAGSTEVSEKGIKDAPFQVTQRGSIYAYQGVFKGAIITDSSIHGADIYTARVHGTGDIDEGEPGLSFYDSNKGIVFFKGDPNPASGEGTEVVEVFSIGTDGLKRGNDYFVKIENDSVKLIGDYCTADEGSYLRFSQQSVIGAHKPDGGAEVKDANIELNQGVINLGFYNDQQQSNPIITITENEDLVEIKSNNVQMSQTVLFGKNLKFEQVNDGYNLFVFERRGN